jgi:hypothetical protein
MLGRAVTVLKKIMVLNICKSLVFTNLNNILNKKEFKKINTFYLYFYSKSSETRKIINIILML